MTRRVVLAAVLGVSVFPSTAAGSTAFMEVDEGSRRLYYVASPGEANQVEMSEAGGIVTIRDSGAVIVADPECVQIDAHEVRCAEQPFSLVFLDDLDDAATIVGGPVLVFGESGDDEITSPTDCTCNVSIRGGDGNDLLTSNGNLYGDAGNDTITGGDGINGIDGGAGDDTIDGGGRGDAIDPGLGNDSVDGGAGPGRDTAVFNSIQAAVVVNLETGQATGQGEDALVGIERVNGSNLSDRLLGNSQTNWLNGGRGGDVLIGRGGADFLDGSSGPDLVRGGRGNDWLRGLDGRDKLYGQRGDDRFKARDGQRDVVRGGLGVDRAWAEKHLDDIAGIQERCPRDCRRTP